MRGDPGGQQFLCHVPPPGAALQGELHVLLTGEPGQPGPKLRPVSGRVRAPLQLPGRGIEVFEGQLAAVHRDGLVAERTRFVNRLRWLVHDLDPELAPAPRSLGSARARAKLEAGLAALPASAGQRIALSQLACITALSAEITGLEQDLAALVTVLVPELLAIRGSP